MKPSQFLYQEFIKEQKEQKVQTTKLSGNLKPSTSQKQIVDNQNQSTIYSLVNLTVKEGQNDKVLFPVSLIPQSSKITSTVMVNKNTEIARSLKKLKPISNSVTTQEEMLQASKGKSIDQQLNGPKIQVYLKQLNKMTDGLFKKTQTQLLFGQIDSKINQNNILCILRIKKLKFFNDYNNKNHKNPSLFCWEVLYRKQSLMKTSPKDFEGAQNDLLDFVYTRNNYENAEIILWKIKNNDEKYVGQFDLTNEDYFGAKEILDYQKRIISENQIEKEMFKTMKQTKSFIGNVQFQLIQFGNEIIPQNRYSGIPGSPKTEEERIRHRIIDATMSGQEYRWYIDENDKLIIQKIDQISQQIVAECTLEVVSEECGQLTIIYEQKYNDPDINGRSRPNSRQMRKQHFDATMALIHELDKNGQFTEIQSNLRALSRQGRLTRKNIEEALYQMGCTANQLLLTECGEFGDCLMDFLLVTDDLSGVLEAMQEIKLIGEDELNLESFSNNLFLNIGQHLRKNTNLKKIINFIKALENKPEIAILIQNYSYASENILSNYPPFLQNFDPKNYEHIMVIGKINKMIEKFNIDSKFTRILKKAHVDAKKSIYFDIPCFPKKQDLDKKAESLQLQAIGQNIMHEIVRRQKWKKSHSIFEKYSEWFFVADSQGITPFSQILEKAPFDVLQSMFISYPEQLNSIFEKYNPYQDLYEIKVPIKQSNKQINQSQNQNNQIKQNNTKLKPFQWIQEQKEYRKNFLHNLIQNKNLTANEFQEILKLLIPLINKSNKTNFFIIKGQKLRSGNFIPLVLYLETLRQKCKRKLDRVQRELGTSLFICKMLNPDLEESELLENQQKINSNFVWDNHNQFIISSIISKLPESLFVQFDDMFQFIQWIPSLEQLKIIRYINLPIRFLIRHKQKQKLIFIFQQIYNEIEQKTYDINNIESDEIIQILYQLQIMILMLLEIRNLRSQHLDSLQNLIFNQLKDLAQQFTDIFVIPMPTNITSTYYPLNYIYKGSPKTLLELVNLIQFNQIILDPIISKFDKLDIKLLGQALSRTQNKEELKNLIKLLLDKDQNKDDTENQNYDSKEFSIIINPNQILDEKESEYREKLNKKQVEKLLLTFKAEQVLPIVCNDKSKFNQIVHNLILNSFYTKKSIGITQQQIIMWIRNYQYKISSKWTQLYIDYFRIKMDLYSIHCLIDIEIYQQKKKIYVNQDKLQPYITAQGNSWAALLDIKRLNQALKDNIQVIDIEDSLRAVAINGQYDKLEIFLSHIKDPQILRQTIVFVCILAEYQTLHPNALRNFQNRRNQFFSLEDLLYFSEDDDENIKQPLRIAQTNTNRQELKRLLREKLDENDHKDINDETGHSKYYDILQSFKILSFDPLIKLSQSTMKQQKEKLKVEKVIFPQCLDQIRTPISVQSQLNEMNQNISIELDSYLKLHYPKCGKLDLQKYEQQFEKDVLTFRHLKNWKQSLQRQNVRSLFIQGYQGSEKFSYRKVLILLMNQFKRYGLSLCKKTLDYQVVIKVLVIYGIININEYINEIVSSKLDIKEKNTLYFYLVTLLNNNNGRRIFDFYFIKNQNMYIQQIHQVIKNLNILEESNKEMMDEILNEIRAQLDKRINPDFLNPLSGLKFKLACEILINFDKLEIKNQFQDKIIEIAKVIRDRKLNDKLLQQLANKYLQEKEQKMQSQIVTFSDIILQFKKKRLEDILQQIDLTYFITKFSDRNCEEIIKELFKLPYEKKYKTDLLKKFDRKLFECLMFYQKFNTYTTLIHQILFKQILKGDQDTIIKIFKQHLESAQIESIKKNSINSQENIQEEDTKNQQDIELNEFSLAQIAAQFNFYEYFDTLHRLNLKVKEIRPQPSFRFTFETNDQLLTLAQEFEKKELNYISNCLKMLRYLRINHYEIDAQQFTFENEIMICFIVENIQLITTPCLNIIKYYLQLNENQQPLWQDTIIQRFSGIKNEQQNKSLFKKKIQEQSLIRLKVNGIENGVKFCFPSNYQSENNEYFISNDDTRKTHLNKIKISIDQYIDYLDKNDRQKLENQLVNDPEFQNILIKLQLFRKNQEFLIDKINFIQFLQKIRYHDHEIYYYLINFPLFWYEDKIPKDQLKIYSFFHEFELGFVFFKAILMFEPNKLDQALQIYFYSLNDYAKKEEQVIIKRKKKKQSYEVSYLLNRHSLSDWEDQEMELVEVEEESEQKDSQDNQKNNGQTELQQDQIVNQQQIQEQSRTKIKKQIWRKKLNNYIEPEDGLRRQVQRTCSNQVQFIVFLQLLFLATTNEESFQLIQKYAIEYQMLPKLQPEKEIELIVKNRLIEYGYKLPFDQQFIEQIKSNINQLPQQQIEDIEHVKQVIRFNQSLKETQYSELIQLLISQVFKSQYNAYQKLIDTILENPANKCLEKQKINIFSTSLEKDKQFQNEIVNYFLKKRYIKQNRQKYRKTQINNDFVQKFFEAKSNSKYTNDKWIHIICLLKFYNQLENQFIEFDQKEVNSRYLIITCLGEVGFDFDASKSSQLDTINPTYHFNFQINSNFKSPIFEYTKKYSEIEGTDCYHFQLDLAINILSCKNPKNPFPIPQIHSQTYDELEKIFRTCLLDFVIFNRFGNFELSMQNEMRKLDDLDIFDSSMIKQKMTTENYEQLTIIRMFSYYYLEEAVRSFGHLIGSLWTLRQIIENAENSPPDETEDYVKSFTIPKINSSIKLIFQDKSYALPLSNYQPRVQNTQQRNIEIDLVFLELYPLTQFQIYKYMPDLITEEESNQKYDSLSFIQSTCIELELYAKQLSEFLNQLPTEEQLNEQQENPIRRDIYWPLITKKIPPKSIVEYKFQYTYIIESMPLYLISYLMENLKLELNHQINFTLNCLSFSQIILSKLIRIIQQQTKKKCKISTSVSLIKEWVWLKKILLSIGNIIVENDFNKFIAYYVEVNEIHPNSAFKFKQNKLEGLDSIFRFGQTQFFVHFGVLVIRLNIAVVSENLQSIMNKKNYKLHQIESGLFQDENEFAKYLQYIVNLEDMLKQMFNKI